MMNPAMHSFDTLQYAKRLQKAGFTVEQSEVQAEAIKELIDDKLATKANVREVSREIRQMEERLTNRVSEMSYKLTIRLGSMIVAGIVVLGALVKLA